MSHEVFVEERFSNFQTMGCSRSIDSEYVELMQLVNKSLRLKGTLFWRRLHLEIEIALGDLVRTFT